MGLPVNKLICASNENNVLYDFFTTGVYDKKRDFIQILSMMSDTEINDYIKTHGKPPKPVVMCRIVNKEDKHE